jgi:hypothetical protein
VPSIKYRDPVSGNFVYVPTVGATGPTGPTGPAGPPGSGGVATTRTISTTAPLTGGGDLSANRTLAIDDFTVSTKGAVPTPGGTSSGRYLKDDGTWTIPPAAATGAGGVFAFTYNTSVLESITGSQLRANNTTMSAATKLWISENTVDGLDVSIGLGRVKAGFQIFIQDYTSASRYVQYRVTADSIDKGTYWEVAVASVASAGTIPGGKVAYQQLSTAQTNTLFSTTTTAAGLAPGSNGAGATAFLNGNAGWTVPPGTGAPLRRTVKADTTTAYAPLLTDENQMVTLSNAAAITVTLPSNATQAFPVGAEVDFLWLGVGQPTFAAGSGATVNATPGLKLRARYSAATAKLIATSTWVIIGDVVA